MWVRIQSHGVQVNWGPKYAAAFICLSWIALSLEPFIGTHKLLHRDKVAIRGEGNEMKETEIAKEKQMEKKKGIKRSCPATTLHRPVN